MKSPYQILTLALLALLPFGAAAQIPRADVLECELPGERRFILKAEYIWYPWAHLTRSGNPRKGGTDFDAYFVRPDDGSLSKAPTAIDHSRSQGGRHRACAGVGFIHGYPVVKKSFLMPNGRWFDPSSLPSRLGPESPHHPPTVRAELRARNLVPANNFAFVVPIGERLVFEWPLTRRGRVEGVFKSESRDGGHTWTDPVISTDAEIYELGKYQREQSFVGRPLRYNGDPVEPWTDWLAYYLAVEHTKQKIARLERELAAVSVDGKRLSDIFRMDGPTLAARGIIYDVKISKQ